MPNHLAAARSENLDLVFQALSDPSRRAVVERLARGPASVSELAKPLNMALPSVMQHLGMLEASGLVRSKKEGRVRMCRMNPAALTQVEKWVNARRAAWEAKLDRLAQYLDETKDEER